MDRQSDVSFSRIFVRFQYSELKFWMSLVDWHLQFQPLHSPVAFPLAWQSSLQVDSAAQSANCFGVSFSSEHWQSKELFTVLHSPVLRPIALQVPRFFFRINKSLKTGWVNLYPSLRNHSSKKNQSKFESNLKFS